MLILVGVFLISCIFPLATYFFLRNAHGDDAEYKKDCRKLLLHGLLLGFPVFGFSLLCSILFALTHIGEACPFLRTLFRAFVLMAFSEELMKFLLARRTIRKNRPAVSFLDMMAYTAAAAIGFELMESVFYLFSSDVPQILVRGVTNMHAVFGLIMGYILAKGVKKNGKPPVAAAVLVPTLIHGAYDLCLDETLIDTPWGGLALLLAVLCLGLNIYNFFFMAKATKNAYYTDPLFPEAPAAEDGAGAEG